MNLGVYHFPRPGRGYSPYPWLEAEVGDTFIVVAQGNLQRARTSLRACRKDAAKRIEWRPRFSLRTAGPNTLIVRRIE